MNKPKLTKPVVGASIDLWGDVLNKNIDVQDSYNQELINDGSRQDQELARLEKDKISQDDLNVLVKNTVDNYVDGTSKPDLDNHVETINKPSLDAYTLNVKKPELDKYVLEVKKPELDIYEKEKESELNTFTEAQKVELDGHEKLKEVELNTHNTDTEIPRLTVRADREIERIRAVGVDGILDEIDFTTGDEFHFDRDENSEDPYGDFKRGKTYKLGELVDKIWEEKQFKVDKDLQTTSKTVVGAINEVNAKKVEIGKGLERVDEVLNVVSEDEGILVNEKLKLNVVDDLLTGGVKRPLSAEQGKVLKQLIDAIGTGGVAKLMRKAELLGEYDYIGNLPASGTSIATGKQLFNANLYLDGVKMNKNQFSVELQTGLITLTKAYSDTYDVTWVVEDDMTPHIKFCFPTMNLLIASEDMKGRIQLDDVIKILGTSEADDGGHYLVKCESTAKLNPVELSAGKYLNEIPNTRIATLKGEIDKNKSDILLRTLAGGYSGTSADLKSLIDGVTNEIGKNVNGWFKDKKTGLIIQWGEFLGIIGSQTWLVNLPITFSSAYTISSQLTSLDGVWHNIQVSAEGFSQFRVRMYNADGSPRVIQYGGGNNFIAIGY